MDTIDILKCALQLVGRIALPEEKVREVIGNRPRQLKAYNLCDGTRTVTEIAKKTRINQGNLSRTTSRWVKNGILFWVGTGNDARLLHVYPLPKL